MTDITELTQSLKAAITEATPGPWYVHDKPCEDGNYGIDTSDKEFLAEAVVWWGFARQSIWREEDAKYIALANPANILALVEALEKARAQSSKWLEAYHKAVSIGARYEERIAELEPFHTAYMAWSDKTDWVRTDRRFDVVKPLGKHLADVLKAYIEHLESRTVTVRLPPLNDDLIAILGRPNFMCAHLAELLRKSGEDIKRKAEHEQAAIIHWFLSIYLEHGDKWEGVAISDMQARAAGAREAE